MAFWSRKVSERDRLINEMKKRMRELYALIGKTEGGLIRLEKDPLSEEEKAPLREGAKANLLAARQELRELEAKFRKHLIKEGFPLGV